MEESLWTGVEGSEGEALLLSLLTGLSSECRERGEAGLSGVQGCRAMLDRQQEPGLPPTSTSSPNSAVDPAPTWCSCTPTVL